jgi:outer membrane beta-barrel protein
MSRTKDKSMKRSFTARATGATSGAQRSLGTGARCILGAIAVALGVAAAPSEAQAQEIQLTGPLAGAPAVRKLRLYREGRAELALGGGFTLLDEYKRTIFLSGRLQYNIFDWLGVGVFGGFAPDALSLNTDLADKIDDTPAPRNSRTATNLSALNAAGKPTTAFGDQAGKFAWMAVPQLTFSPFRGKLALFQKLFVDTDLYVHGGVAFIGVKERADCGGNGQASCTSPASFTQSSRVAIAPSFGLGLTLYPSNFISFNVEYRAFPFSYNRGGFDSRGTGPDASFPDNKIDSEDRTFKFNQMIFVAVGFALPTKPKLSE